MCVACIQPTHTERYSTPSVHQRHENATGAIKQALQQQGAHGTTIDSKIQQRLSARAAKHDTKKRKRAEQQQARRGGDAAAAAAAAKAAAAAGAPSGEDDDEDDEEEGGSEEGLSSGGEEEGDESDEDAPLPGEEDDGDEDDAMEGSSGGDDDDDDDDDASESEEEEDEPPAKGKAAAAAAAAAKQQQAKQLEKKKQEQQQKQQQQQQKAKGKKGQPEPEQEQEDGDSGDDDRGAAARRRQQPGAGPSGRGAGAGAGDANGGGGGGGGFYAATPEGTRYSAASFADLQLSRPLLRACEALGYASPTPIQAACVPLALAGRDICGSAVTGSGKTAAFALPILERLLYRPRQSAAIYVLILTPTRELAVQIHSMITKLAQFTDVAAALIVGGLSLQSQAAALRQGPEVVVATPGRIIDHLRNTQSFGLEDLAVLVLDEADRLLEMGFKEEVQEIVRLAPRRRQTMLFSATFSDQVRDLMALSLRAPVRLAADAAAAAPRGLVQEVVRLKVRGGVCLFVGVLVCCVFRGAVCGAVCVAVFGGQEGSTTTKHTPPTQQHINPTTSNPANNNWNIK